MKNLIKYKLYEKYMFSNTFTSFVNEASKVDSLINKIGFNQKIADYLYKECGPLSIWMANIFIEFKKKTWSRTLENLTTTKIIVDRLNDMNFETLFGYDIHYIMDWIKVALNGSLGSNKDLTYPEILEKATEWHNSLEIGQGDINYDETHEIVIDYRVNGIGFYWTNLDTNENKEEGERMGHCAHTSSDNSLYSLRNDIKLNDKYTLNKSILTAAIGNEDGMIYQLKDAGNKKPDDKYHDYIIDLLLNDNLNGIGSGAEYRSSNDFCLNDLNDDRLKKLYTNKPTIFKKYTEKMLLINKKLIDKNEVNTKFICSILPDQIQKYVNGTWITGTRTNKYDQKEKVDFFETLLDGDLDFQTNSYDGDWQNAIKYNINEENKVKILELVKVKALEDDTDLEDLDLIESIKDLDCYDIIDSIRECISYCEYNGYYKMYIKTLSTCLEYYGDVTSLDYDGAKINCDFMELTSDVELSDIDDVLDDIHELTPDKFDEALYELLNNNYIDKPKFSIDDRWTPNINDKDFNENLKEKLNEI